MAVIGRGSSVNYICHKARRAQNNPLIMPSEEQEPFSWGTVYFSWVLFKYQEEQKEREHTESIDQQISYSVFNSEADMM